MLFLSVLQSEALDIVHYKKQVMELTLGLLGLLSFMLLAGKFWLKRLWRKRLNHHSPNRLQGTGQSAVLLIVLLAIIFVSLAFLAKGAGALTAILGIAAIGLIMLVLFIPNGIFIG